MDFFNCLIGGGAHKATSVISVEIASDLMPVMKVVPKMPPYDCFHLGRTNVLEYTFL